MGVGRGVCWVSFHCRSSWLAYVIKVLALFLLFFLCTQSIHRICGVCVGVCVCVGVWVFGCVTVFVLVGMALRLMRALHTQVTTCRWFESF